MLRFFRAYVMNKWTLAIAGVVLMVVFLLPTQDVFSPDPGKQTIGAIADGHAFTADDQLAAANDIETVTDIFRSSGMFADLVATDQDPVHWMLMLHEAERLGLAASNAEAEVVLGVLGLGEGNRLNVFARNRGVAPARIRAAVRHWLTLLQYRETMLGLTHVKIEDRLRAYQQITQALQMNIPVQFIEPYVRAATGRPRLSQPMVERFVHDVMASVKVAGVVVPASRYLEKVPTPDQAKLKELFDKYKDNLVGQSEPYGFGYKFPDRVKLEYLSIPFDRLKQKVAVDEADALAYYDANPAEFTLPSAEPAAPSGVAAPPKVQPYEEVRQQVLDRLRNQAASRLGEDMVKEAQAQLLEDSRALELVDGYRVLPAGFSPTSLAAVAERLQQKFGVLPDVRRIDEWRDVQSLGALDGLGDAVLPDARGMAPLPVYVAAAKELNPPQAHPLIARRLQVGLPGAPLIDPEGNRYFFRLTEADPTHAPTLIDEVLPQVVYDARRLEAYDLLLKERQAWLERFAGKEPKALASELGVEEFNPPAFSKVDLMGGGMGAPDVPGVGRNKQFIGDVFAMAMRVSDAGGIEKVPVTERVDALPLDNRLALALVRLDEYQSVPRSQVERAADPATLASLASAMLQDAAPQPGDAEEQDEAAGNPLSLEAITERLGFKPAQ